MGVGAVGGASLGAGAIGGAAGIGAAQFSGVGGISGTAISGTQAAGSAAMTAQMQNLISLLQGFSSAEILMALMLAGGSNGDNHHKKTADAAMGFLIGMAMSAQMPQFSIGGNCGIPGVDAGGMAGMAGAQLNVHA